MIQAKVLVAIGVTVLTAGFWIGLQWVPAHQIEQLDGLLVEGRCWDWTDGYNRYTRTTKGLLQTLALRGDHPNYKCLHYSW
jgi:hypothetical protein